MTNILITGGAGFIGCNAIRFLLKKYPNYNIVNVDKLTYAGKKENIEDLKNFENYTFIKGDICDYNSIYKIFKNHDINKIVHFAAESHVDNSIDNPLLFAKTNILGTLNLLNVSREFWNDNYSDKLFYHVSTDEVYGSLGDKGFFTEQTPYNPRSPYSASKASSDHFVRSYNHTYGLPYIISNCSNNYGPYQDTEKLIPLFIKNIYFEKDLPIYGDGNNIRDWLYVEDHVRAIDTIIHSGEINKTYNIGGLNEWKNIDIVDFIINYMDNYMGKPKGYSNFLKKFVKDRKGHDFRYAIDNSLIKNELKWTPKYKFEDSIKKTIRWYINRFKILDE